MGDTKIEWCNKVWNCLRGCSRVSEGCRFCYAERVAARFSDKGMSYEGLAVRKSDGPHWTGEIKLVREKLNEPLYWKKPSRIFVNSMSDIFHEKVPFSYIEEMCVVMALSQRHTFQVLTKRPERMLEFFTNTDFGRGFLHGNFRHIWWGVSVEDQKTADWRIPILLETGLPVCWISAEPLLGPIYVRKYLLRPMRIPSCMSGDGPEEYGNKLSWVVVGGESGPGARPCDRRWIYDIVKQCKDTEVPVFVKQLGAKSHIAGRNEVLWRDRKGGDINEFPIELQVREYPA